MAMIQRRIDPIATSEDLRQTYLRYLTTTFGLKQPDLARQFQELARDTEGLFRGPVLQATPKYRQGMSLLELATEDPAIISEEFLNYAPGLSEEKVSECLALERKLYAHQETALRKTIGENRNVVIATGTGSGKTECFLFPIIDYLLRERSMKRLGPGVRALLIYPMNALANDQVVRLRQMLPPETGITFGRYTGHTKQTYRQGLDAFQQENGRIPQRNELFCRDQILGVEPGTRGEWPHAGYDPVVGPPHFLLTNFAMLEYLLMRPRDSMLFDGPAGETWRFLVLDEAHVYTGAQGTEISYLMRRLKDRVCKSQAGKLLCIATSATIGAKDAASQEAVAESFRNLFGERFDKQDIVMGEVVPLEAYVAGFSEWGSGSTEFYQALWQFIEEESSSDLELADVFERWFDAHTRTQDLSGWPDITVAKRAISAVRKNQDKEAAKEGLLFHLLAGDRRVRRLICKIESQPADLHQAAREIWGDFSPEFDFEAAQKNLILIVDLASRARLTRESAPLLSARYHFFVRSLEGLSLYFTKSDGKEKDAITPVLLAGRHRNVLDTQGEPTVAFELQACSRCGQPFLRGYLNPEDGRFVSYPQRKRLDEDAKTNDFFVLYLDDLIESAEDEDPLRDESPPTATQGEDEEELEKDQNVRPGPTILGETQYLCARCGFVSAEKTKACPLCRKEEKRVSYEWVPVRKVTPSRGKVLKACVACGARKYYGGSIIRAFSPGDEAAGAVLSQCLLTNIPMSSEQSIEASTHSEAKKPKGRFAHLAIPSAPTLRWRGKRRLLAFSDSRQDAAYFATYLNRTASQILHRQLILLAIRRFQHDNPGIEYLDVNDLISPLITEAQAVGLFGLKDTEGTKVSEVCKWLTGELASIQRRHSVEGVGLLTWRLKNANQLLDHVRPYEEGLIKDYHLNAEEFIILVETLLAELRRQNVLQPIKNVRIQDPYFWPRNRPYTIRKNAVNSKLSIASWLPQSARNIRSDLIERLYARLGLPSSKELVSRLLDDIWDLTLAPDLDIWEEVPSVVELWGRAGSGEVAWRLRWNAWVCHLNRSNGAHLYKCDSCGNISPLSLKGVCPGYRCPGNLVPIEPGEEFADNHYRHLYAEVSPILVEALEHTAQITTQEGAERQHSFSNDQDALNVLSCSTTFELGVDVGQLHSVFLRNVPPGVANYVQRAGRAGRRWSAAAYVLTFCRSRPHDLGHFQRVDGLISGQVQPPRIQLDNVRIARRHAQATTLSRFWRFHHPELFEGPGTGKRGIVQWFFFDLKETGAHKLYSWLQERPNELYEELNRILPETLCKELEIESWGWVPELVDPPKTESPNVWEGHLGYAQSELLSEYQAYQDLQKAKPVFHGYADKQMKRLLERQILGFLASRNVLPKYGFPVDVVSLKIESKDEWAQRVELDRDLKIALSEYAPGCTLVANGKIIKSYALEKVTGKAWPEYRFAVCNRCGRFYRSKTVDEPVPDRCECGQAFDDSSGTELEGRFVEPVFGFRTFLDEDGQEPVEVRPQRTFSSRVFFSHYRVAPQESFTFEGDPDAKSGIKIQKRYSRYGVLAVINPGRMKRGFWLCPSCGFGDAVAGGKPENHKTPWGTKCLGKPRRVFLGHEFQSDVLELRFGGATAQVNDQGFWLSLTASPLAGAARTLVIERDDTDGTVLQYGGEGYRSVVLFDSVPGGAGHVRRIASEFQSVLKAAFEIAETCTGCSVDQSCNGCLRNFRNQYAHDLLKRGPVADFLRKTINSLYGPGVDGFIPLGLRDLSQWLFQQMKMAKRVDLILDEIPVVTSEEGRQKDWLRVIHDIALKGSKVHFFLREDPKEMLKLGTIGKASLHAFTTLSQFSNVAMKLLPIKQKIMAPMFLESEDHCFAIRWPAGMNLFQRENDFELSTYDEYTRKVRVFNEGLLAKKELIDWDMESLEKLLQGAIIRHVGEGRNQGWEQLVGEYLPEKIEGVEIYDRFVRNRFQFKSLEMFLEAIAKRALEGKCTVEVTTTSEEPEAVRSLFQKLQEGMALKGIKLKYRILEPVKELPHYRKVVLHSAKGTMSIWLERGLDIFRFDDLKGGSFKTLESCIVIDKQQVGL